MTPTLRVGDTVQLISDSRDMTVLAVADNVAEVMWIAEDGTPHRQSLPIAALCSQVHHGYGHEPEIDPVHPSAKGLGLD